MSVLDDEPTFRPRHRRRNRILVGAALVAIALAGNLAIYGSLDRRSAVLQLARDVPAGAEITAGDLRVVEVGADATVRTVASDHLDTVVGRVAKVRLVSGSLLVNEALQSEPLVAPGAAVVALLVPDGSLPSGLRERSEVHLVVATRQQLEDATIRVIPGRVVGLPNESGAVTGRISVSVEVALGDAPVLAGADEVRVVLVPPSADGEEVTA